MSNKLFQSMVLQFKDVINTTLGVLDESGSVVACTDLSLIGTVKSDVLDELTFANDRSYIENGFTYLAADSNSRPDYAVFILGTDEISKDKLKVVAVAIQCSKEYYDEKYDKINFIKNIVLDNVLPGDIYIKAKELRFDEETDRVVMIIRLDDKVEFAAFDVISAMFPQKHKDFVFNVSEHELVLVKELRHNISTKDLEKLAQSIEDTITGEFFSKVSIGIGNTVTSIKDLGRSFKEAQVALEIGKLFYSEKNILSYSNLGIGRLIYQLPTTLCNMFINEVFKKGSLEELDHETLFTIQKFFENNLNVSETSRKLYVHRNTLVYRLEKIRRITGLDLREFDDAIIFQVALMVKKYLGSSTSRY